MPPTKSILLMALGLTFDFLRVSLRQIRARSRKGDSSCSNSSLETTHSKSIVSPFKTEKFGRNTLARVSVSSIFFVFSAVPFKALSLKSVIGKPGCLPLNFLIIIVLTTSSNSFPPSSASPCEQITSITPPIISRIVMSRVPPPKSKTRSCSSVLIFFIPKARAAAVGSLIKRITLSPANSPATLVAVFCASFQLAGTVITTSVIFSCKDFSAYSTKYLRINADISSGRYCTPPNKTLSPVPIFRFTSRTPLPGRST